MKRRSFLKAVLASPVIGAAARAEPKPLVIKNRKDAPIIERAIRRYVRRSGGFRKNLPERQKEHCTKLLALLGRTKSTWDSSIDTTGVVRMDIDLWYERSKL